MHRVFVTGGTGFIGANLIRRLLREGCKVHVAVRETTSDWRIRDIRDEIQLHVVNLADATSTASLLRDVAPDTIYHLASFGSSSWQTDFALMIDSTLLSTHNLLQAASGLDVATFVYTGSSSEYGIKDHACGEGEPLEPNSHYAVLKAAASHLCCLAAKENVPAVVMRLYSAYGPFEHPNRLVPTLLVKSLEKRYPPLVEPGIARDFVYVDDVIDALLLASNAKPGNIYNIRSGEMSTIESVVTAVRRLAKIEDEPEWGGMANRDWDTTHWAGDSSRARTELGWEAENSLDDGLEQTLRWLKDTPGMLEYYRGEVASCPSAGSGQARSE